MSSRKRKQRSAAPAAEAWSGLGGDEEDYSDFDGSSGSEYEAEDAAEAELELAYENRSRGGTAAVSSAPVSLSGNLSFPFDVSRCSCFSHCSPLCESSSLLFIFSYFCLWRRLSRPVSPSSTGRVRWRKSHLTPWKQRVVTRNNSKGSSNRKRRSGRAQIRIPKPDRKGPHHVRLRKHRLGRRRL